MAPFLVPIHSSSGADNGRTILKGALIEMAALRRKVEQIEAAA
jgi:hypothetical protein